MAAQQEHAEDGEQVCVLFIVAAVHICTSIFSDYLDTYIIFHFGAEQ